ncbi:MAG: rhodanese-like domain-containing protein [Oligoflexales bacterium]
MIKEIEREEMEELLDNGALLVDVRETDELIEGVIQGSVHMPLSTFDTLVHTLPKNKPIVFYCRSGRRSLKSAEIAKNLGYVQELYSLVGGYLAYAEEEDFTF